MLCIFIVLLSITMKINKKKMLNQLISFKPSTLIIFYSCFDKGPGVSIDYIVDTISFLIAIGFVWFAFLALFCSKPKGKAKFRYEQLENTP